MDTGKINNNYEFYIGFEDEPEIQISSDNDELEVLHIWDGYFDDIFSSPKLDGTGWKGFTRDYQQLEGAFSDEGEYTITNLYEYLEDLQQYNNKKFNFEDTKAVYNSICSWLTKAINFDCKEVNVKIIQLLTYILADKVDDIKLILPTELIQTHKVSVGKKYDDLVGNIRKNGIFEPIKYVEYNGNKYVVDGHHRLRAAKQLKLDKIPVEKVYLPYKGYKTIKDLLWFDY